MPIYEFYCRRCHAVLSFFSAAVDTETRPACPRCGAARLPRRPSTFAALTHRATEGGGEDDDPFGDLDEGRLEAAMESVMKEMEGGDDEDPRQVARWMRSFGEAAGLEPGPRLEEMLHRLEAGEDPDRLEEEMESAGADETSLEELFRRRVLFRERHRRQPRVDPELYFL